MKPARTSPLDISVLDHLLSTASIGFAFVDPSHRFVRVSSTLAEINGLAIPQHIGRAVSDVVGPENWSAIRPHCERALEGHAICDVDVNGVFPYAPNVRRHVLASFYPIQDKGHVSGFGLGVKDVTAHVKAEQERTELRAKVREFGEMRHSYLTEMLRALTEGKLRLCSHAEDLPLPSEPVGPPLPLSADVLSLFRHQVMDAAHWLAFSEPRTGDIVLAVGEALDNALVHASGGTAQVFVDSARGVLQVRVEDHGPGIDESELHRAALERGYTTAGTLGQGFCLMLNTCDRLWLLTTATGTTLVLEQDRVAAAPSWMMTA